MSSSRPPHVVQNPFQTHGNKGSKKLPAGEGDGSSRDTAAGAAAPRLPFPGGTGGAEPPLLRTLRNERTVTFHDRTFVRQGGSSGRHSFALARRQPTSLSEEGQQTLSRLFLRPENQGKSHAFRLKADPETFRFSIDMGETTSTPKKWVFLIEGTWASPIRQEAYLPEEILGEIIRPSRGSAMVPPPPPGGPALPQTLAPYRSSQPVDKRLRVRGDSNSVQNGRPIKGLTSPELEMTRVGMTEVETRGQDLESPSSAQPDGFEGIVLEVAHTPTQQIREAQAERDAALWAERKERQRGAAELLFRAACGTPCRKTGFILLLALILGGLGVAGFYIYRRLNPSCREDFSLTQRGSNAVSGPLNLWFGASSEAGILVSFACLALTAAKFRTRAPEITLTGTQVNGSLYEEVLDQSVMTPQQNGLSLNIKRLREMPCGTEEPGQLSIKVVDDRENIHRASTPLVLKGQGTPFAILNANDSRTLSVTAGMPFSPFAGLTPVVCFGGRLLEVNLSTTVTGSQLFSSAYSGLTPLTFRGNASEAFRFIQQHRGQINPDEIYSGDGSYYLGGATITDLETLEVMTTARVILSVSNPFRPSSFSGSTEVSLTPGVAERAFLGQQYQGNRYDLIQMQVTMNRLGLTLSPALNVIETGNTGFVCIGTLPYCMDYLLSTTFTLGIGPSGTWSYAHAEIATRALLSPLPANPRRELQVSGCNPVVLVTPVWTRPPRVMRSFFFYPAEEMGFNATVDAKDALRTDISGYVSLFEASRSQLWFEGERVGSFSSVTGFIRNTSIAIPATWEPGTESLFNFTVCTGFNATNCQGQPIPYACTTRIIPHEVIDFPETIDLPEGAFAFLNPGVSVTLDTYFEPVEENLGQGHTMSLSCEEKPASVPPGYEGLCFSPLGPLYSDSIQRKFRQEDARGMLANFAFAAPDYNAIDPSANGVLVGCQAACNLTYGNASESVTFQRRGNQRRLEKHVEFNTDPT